MKIVFASTPSQEEEIDELIRYFYTNVFPTYFSEQEIKEFERLKVLHASARHFEHFGTLREAFRVMACLQTLIFILEASVYDDFHAALFSKNAAVLKDYGLYFPFEYDQFVNIHDLKSDLFGMYSKPANQMLV